ncbi:MAG: extracellular solute-binding protein [Proteobacteria bacterium]|nr:extracellular solute-binding protein [Pseudomonadota bacterium]
MPRIGRRGFLIGASAAGLAGASLRAMAADELPKRYAGTTLNILSRSSPSVDATIAVGDAFTEATGIKLQYTRIAPGDQYQKMILDLTSGGHSYDITLFVYQWKYEVAPYLADLTTLEKDVPGAPSLALADYPAKLLEIYCKVDSKLIGLPLIGDVSFMLWNKEAYRGAGLDPEAGPKTWQDIVQRGKQLTKGEKFGYALPAAKAIQCAVTWILLYHSFGGRYLDANGRPDLGGEAGLAAMRYMANELEPIAPPGNLTWDYSEMLNSFLTAQSGQGMMWPGGFAALYDPAKSAVVGKFGITPPPGGSLLGGTSIGINAKSTQPEAARLYLAWLTSQATVKRTAFGGTSPARLSALSDAGLIQRFPHYPAVQTAMLGDTFGYIPLKESEQIHVMIYDEANAACAKAKTAEQAAADLQQKAIQFMTRRGYIK